MSQYTIISKLYMSNCLIEALKAKMRNPNIKIYYLKPILRNGHFQNLHFMWSDGTADYDFSDLDDNDSNNPCKHLLYKGVIRKFRLGFAQ